MTQDGYFLGASGKRYEYAAIAKRVRAEAPHTLGKHISYQLEALDLLEEMQSGTTPCGLPFTFAEAEVQKQLTSSALVNTPGFFRAMQHDYRAGKKHKPTRERAIKIMSDVYGLSREESDGILSGSLPVEIDDEAGTVTLLHPSEQPEKGVAYVRRD